MLQQIKLYPENVLEIKKSHGSTVLPSIPPGMPAFGWKSQSEWENDISIMIEVCTDEKAQRELIKALL